MMSQWSAFLYQSSGVPATRARPPQAGPVPSQTTEVMATVKNLRPLLRTPQSYASLSASTDTKPLEKQEGRAGPVDGWGEPRPGDTPGLGPGSNLAPNPCFWGAACGPETALVACRSQLSQGARGSRTRSFSPQGHLEPAVLQ